MSGRAIVVEWTGGATGLVVETEFVGQSADYLVEERAARLRDQVFQAGAECLGVFRSVQRPTYEDVVNKQMEDVLATRGPGKLEDLFASDETWTVE